MDQTHSISTEIYVVSCFNFFNISIIIIFLFCFHRFNRYREIRQHTSKKNVVKKKKDKLSKMHLQVILHIIAFRYFVFIPMDLFYCYTRINSTEVSRNKAAFGNQFLLKEILTNRCVFKHICFYLHKST